MRLYVGRHNVSCCLEDFLATAEVTFIRRAILVSPGTCRTRFHKAGPNVGKVESSPRHWYQASDTTSRCP